MLGTNQLEEGMLDDTLRTFRNSDNDLISPAEGVRLIEGWLEALTGDPNMDQLKGQLGELRTALQANQPDSQYVRDLLNSLADKAQAIAEDENSEGTWTGGLESLSKILRSAANNQ
ncbi:hypothetical protein GCM10028805_38350 [Spirosoma harenae]